jgi:hypothetical protein
LEELYEGIDFHEWHEVIPSVAGYEPYVPASFEDAEQHPHIFRSNDQLLAYEAAKHTELHAKMITIVEFIIGVNKLHEMWQLFDGEKYPDTEFEEYPGASFVFALSLHDKKYLKLYADFLLSIEKKYAVVDRDNPTKVSIEHSFKYFGYDIIRQIKKWGWCSDTYYLLLAYWFFDDTEKEVVLEYLSHTGFPLDLKDDSNFTPFVESLESLLKQSHFSNEELMEKHTGLFNELVDNPMIFTDGEKEKQLKIHYQELTGTIQSKKRIEELDEI